MALDTMFDLRSYAKSRRQLIEEKLDSLFQNRDPIELWESMRYSVLSGGKRIRAMLCIAAAEAVAQQNSDGTFVDSPTAIAISCACAIEMIHAMSLIHDDLPCMDNDDYRRGQLTNHKKFGEAMALLAGDALLVYATEVLIRQTPASVSPAVLMDVVAELARAAGPDGMVGGQVADSVATILTTGANSQSQSTQLLESIHKRKTGALLRFSVWSGARLLEASDDVVMKLGRYGEILGLAFQIADDLLDVTGDIKTLGKTPGKDQAAGKLTWVTVYGMDGSRQALNQLREEGKTLLRETKLSERALEPLDALLEFAMNRTS